MEWLVTIVFCRFTLPLPLTRIASPPVRLGAATVAKRTWSVVVGAR